MAVTWARRDFRPTKLSLSQLRFKSSAMEENELLAVRRQKLQQLIEKNWSPFGGRFDVSGTIEEIRQGFVEGTKVALAGRITAHRNMGKSQFVDLSDLTGRMQVYLNLKELPPEQAELFGLVDIGDFLGVTGETFVTKTGEPTVRAESFRLLSKTLRPLPTNGMASPTSRSDTANVILI